MLTERLARRAVVFASSTGPLLAAEGNCLLTLAALQHGNAVDAGHCWLPHSIHLRALPTQIAFLQVLTQLEAALREAGTSKDCLLAVTVLLKDLPVGRKPFAAAFNEWVDPKALPAMTLLESYLGRCAACS